GPGRPGSGRPPARGVLPELPGSIHREARRDAALPDVARLGGVLCLRGPATSSGGDRGPDGGAGGAGDRLPSLPGWAGRAATVADSGDRPPATGARVAEA